jgi:hypothetical protein
LQARIPKVLLPGQTFEDIAALVVVAIGTVLIEWIERQQRSKGGAKTVLRILNRTVFGYNYQ